MVSENSMSQNPTDAEMKDGMLTMRQLMSLSRSSPGLAILSACETAKGDTKQANQSLHLASTLLHVGFSSVVATLW